MPARSWKIRIQDILERIARIKRYTQDMNLEEFGRSEMAIDAVIYNFAVIGEAARHIPPEVIQRYPRVPWTDMRDMRNVVIHEYSEVSPQIPWDTVTEDLPPLVPMLQNILEREA